MAQATQDPVRRREALVRDLENARKELAEVNHGLDRYEKQIELPRILADIQRFELEIAELDLA